jgi:hypothetical protein
MQGEGYKAALPDKPANGIRRTAIESRHPVRHANVKMAFFYRAGRNYSELT